MKKLYTLLIATLCTAAAFAGSSTAVSILRADENGELQVFGNYTTLNNAFKAALNDGDIIQVNEQGLVAKNLMQGVAKKITIQGVTKDITLKADYNVPNDGSTPAIQPIIKMDNAANADTELTLRNITLTRDTPTEEENEDATLLDAKYFKNYMILQRYGKLTLEDVEFKDFVYDNTKGLIRVETSAIATELNNVTLNNVDTPYLAYNNMNSEDYSIVLKGDANYNIYLKNANSLVTDGGVSVASHVGLFINSAQENNLVVKDTYSYNNFSALSAIRLYPDINKGGLVATKSMVMLVHQDEEGNYTYTGFSQLAGASGPLKKTNEVYDFIAQNDVIYVLNDLTIGSAMDFTGLTVDVKGFRHDPIALSVKTTAVLLNATKADTHLTFSDLIFKALDTDPIKTKGHIVSVGQKTSDITLNNVTFKDLLLDDTDNPEYYVLRCNQGALYVNGVTIDNCTLPEGVNTLGFINCTGSKFTGKNSELSLTIGTSAKTGIDCEGLETPLTLYPTGNSDNETNTLFITNNTNKELFTIVTDYDGDWKLANNSHGGLTLYYTNVELVAPVWPEIPNKDVTIGEETYQHFDNSQWWITHENGVMHYPYLAKIDADKTGTTLHFDLEKAGLANTSLLYSVAPYEKIGDEPYIGEETGGEEATEEAISMALMAYADEASEPEFTLYDHSKGLTVADESNITLKLVNSDNHDAASEPLVLQAVNPNHVQTGVENVAAESVAAVEYYTLQGVRVANPANGIFIRRQGAKATKVVL